MLYAIGSLFLRRWRWVPLTVLLLVPPSVPWFLATGRNLYGAFQETNWIIPGARFEFPLFSLFLGNAHAFEMAAFNQFLLIFLLGFAWLRWGGLDAPGRWGLALFIAVSIGSMPLLSSGTPCLRPVSPSSFSYLGKGGERFGQQSWRSVTCLIYPCSFLLEPAGVGGSDGVSPPPRLCRDLGRVLAISMPLSPDIRCRQSTLPLPSVHRHRLRRSVV